MVDAFRGTEGIPIYYANGIHLQRTVDEAEFLRLLPSLSSLQTIKAFSGCPHLESGIVLQSICDLVGHQKINQINPDELREIGLPNEHSSTFSVPIFEEDGRQYIVFVPDDRLAQILPRLSVRQLLRSFAWCDHYYGLLHARTQMILGEIYRRMERRKNNAYFFRNYLHRRRKRICTAYSGSGRRR